MKFKAISLIILFLSTLSFKPANDLSDKNVALFGDSMTWYGGDKCNKKRGWSYHFKRIAKPKSITVYARSGATWTNTTSTNVDTDHYTEKLNDQNVIYNQVMRLLDDVNNGKKPKPDLVVMYAGANDTWFSARRPGIFDVTTEQALNAPPFADGTKPSEVTSLAGSIRLCHDIVKKNFPDARIVFITPLEMAKASVEETTRIASIIEEMGEGLGVEVYRADKDVDIRHNVEIQKKKKYTRDGVHTNNAGAKLLGTYISSRLTK